MSEIEIERNHQLPCDDENLLCFCSSIVDDKVVVFSEHINSYASKF